MTTFIDHITTGPYIAPISLEALNEGAEKMQRRVRDVEQKGYALIASTATSIMGGLVLHTLVFTRIERAPEPKPAEAPPIIALSVASSEEQKLIEAELALYLEDGSLFELGDFLRTIATKHPVLQSRSTQWAEDQFNLLWLNGKMAGWARSEFRSASGEVVSVFCKIRGASELGRYLATHAVKK
jgi:hypothetical protein